MVDTILKDATIDSLDVLVCNETFSLTIVNHDLVESLDFLLGKH
jgi:hypothetical protein